MTLVTGKRKRDDRPLTSTKTRKIAAHSMVNGHANASSNLSTEQREHNAPASAAPSLLSNGRLHVQIVTGSYERVLHGFSASIPPSLLQKAPITNEENLDEPTPEDDSRIAFSDTFLFAAHASSIRCLALSPPTEADKRFLATGSSDERINVYSVSTAPPSTSSGGPLPSLTSTSITENRRNRSLGSLIHHDRAITCLDFPAKGKLFSAAEDNTIAISRTRDWTVLSSIKAPMPKAQGRPSGDTAGPGETPAGVNDFAIHPSQKLMLSVGRGERCMRLWNLMTGKKAGVLNFDRAVLSQVGEGKYSSGEGRRVRWHPTGDSYVVGFERGAVVYGIDSQPKAIIRPLPTTKFHQMRFLPSEYGSGSMNPLAISTEDGRVLFFDTAASESETAATKLPSCTCLAQVGGTTAGVTGRVKDFELIHLPSTVEGTEPCLLLVTAGSDGVVRLWTLAASEIVAFGEAARSGTAADTKQIGRLIGTLETGNRVTCLGAFVMDGKVSEENGLDGDGADPRGDDDEEGESDESE